MCRYCTVKRRNNIVDLKESQKDGGWTGFQEKKKKNMANFGKYSFCISAHKCIMEMCKSRTYKIKWLKTFLQETFRKRADRGKRKKV